MLPIPLLGTDQVQLDLCGCFAAAYDRIAADDEVDYGAPPPPPPLSKINVTWIDQVLRERGLRAKKRRGEKRK
jgi:hypothetical protein